MTLQDTINYVKNLKNVTSRVEIFEIDGKTYEITLFEFDMPMYHDDWHIAEDLELIHIWDYWDSDDMSMFNKMAFCHKDELEKWNEIEEIL